MMRKRTMLLWRLIRLFFLRLTRPYNSRLIDSILSPIHSRELRQPLTCWTSDSKDSAHRVLKRCFVTRSFQVETYNNNDPLQQHHQNQRPHPHHERHIKTYPHRVLSSSQKQDCLQVSNDIDGNSATSFTASQFLRSIAIVQLFPSKVCHYEILQHHRRRGLGFHCHGRFASRLSSLFSHFAIQQ